MVEVSPAPSFPRKADGVDDCGGNTWKKTVVPLRCLPSPVQVMRRENVFVDKIVL